MPAFKDISLQQFGRLMALFPVGRNKKEIVWACLCDCGEIAMAQRSSLTSGATKSCGCLQREVARRRMALVNSQIVRPRGESHPMFGRHGKDAPSFKHGYTSHQHISPTWGSWNNMIRRCTKSNATAYEVYGGAGVKVCDRWQGEHGFENFLADMGERPTGTTLGRFGDAGDYEPTNCAWQTWKQQGCEKRLKHQRLKAAA